MTENLPDILDSSPALWQAALDQSASGILVYEAVRRADGVIDAFRVKLANRRAEQMLGLSRADMLGQLNTDLFPVSFNTDLSTNISRVIGTDQPLRYDYFYTIPLTSRSSWFDLNIEPLGNGQSAVVSFTDITERKLSQQDLLGESILFKTLSSSVPDTGVVVVSFFRKILFANGMIPHLFGDRNALDLLDRRIDRMVLSEFAEAWDRYVTTALDGQTHTFRDSWGGWHYEVFVGPVRNETGQVVMALIVFRDITELHRQRQVMEQMNVSLRQSNEGLEQFAYVASHDLQEPLRKIRSFGDMLQARYGEVLDETGLDMLHRMQSAANRMSELIRSLLAFARLSAQQLPFGPVNLNDVLADILADTEVVQREQAATISVGPLPTLPGDAVQLRQLFQNLLTNAVKFARPGVCPVVRVESRAVANSVEISVADNGIGIAAQNFDRIFGLFNRLHGKQQFAGTGIGLAISKRVAENHGGSITLESEQDKGTTFRVILPMVEWLNG
jgi:PAS domain S-box-containing protein